MHGAKLSSGYPIPQEYHYAKFSSRYHL